jgi:hypothetical protein
MLLQMSKGAVATSQEMTTLVVTSSWLSSTMVVPAAMTTLVQPGSASAARSEPAPESAPEETRQTPPDAAALARDALRPAPRAADCASARAAAQARTQMTVDSRGAMAGAGMAAGGAHHPKPSRRTRDARTPRVGVCRCPESSMHVDCRIVLELDLPVCPLKAGRLLCPKTLHHAGRTAEVTPHFNGRAHARLTAGRRQRAASRAAPAAWLRAQAAPGAGAGPITPPLLLTSSRSARDGDREADV